MPNGNAPVANNFVDPNNIPPGVPLSNDTTSGTSSTGTPTYQTGVNPIGTATNSASVIPPQPITPSDISGSAIPQNFQVPNTTPVLSAPPVAPLQPTPSEGQAQDISTQLQGLNEQLAGKSAYEIQQAQNLGYGVTTDANGNIQITDPDLISLNNQVTALQNQAQAIPLQMMNNAQGTGATEGGIDSLQTAALRQNAIQTLQVSSLVAIKQGQLSMAQQMVNQAVTQKYAPLQDQITALTNNLQLIQNSPEYSLEEQNRAQQQQLVLNQQSAELNLEVTNYTNAQNEVLKYGSVASADQLQAMQQATTPAQVDAIAASLGLQTPVAGRYKTSITTVTNEFGQQVPMMTTTDSITGQVVGSQPYSGSASSGTVVGTSSTPPNGSQTQATANQPSTASTQNSGGTSTGQGLSPVTSEHSASGYSTQVGSGAQHLSLSEYGLLANTDLNPNNSIDQMALTYINSYLKNGTVPSYTALGRGITPAGMGQVTARANQLYQEATGNSLSGVNPAIIEANQAQIAKNTGLLANLNNQIGTVQKNMGLNLSNINKAGVNQLAPAINALIDPVAEALGYTDVSTYLAQNNTIQAELGSLLAVKNASGTTVADKLAAGDLLPADLSAAQQQQILTTLMSEAQNQQQSIGSTNAGLYKQIDPLMQDPNNPARTQLMNSQFVESQLESQGINYNSLMAEMTPQAPAGTQPALDAQTGQIGFATPEAIASGAYISL